MKNWSRKNQSCVNCNTQRYPHKAKGYCNRCYKLIKKIEIVKKWDILKEESMIGFPGNKFDNQKQFQKIKTNDVLSLQKNKLKTVMQRVDVIARKRGLRSEDETFTDSQGYASWEDKGKSVLTVTKDGIKVNKNYKKWNYLKNDLEKARKRDLGIKEEEEDV